MVQPKSSTKANPTDFGATNGKFGFDPGEIAAADFLAKVAPANAAINTLTIHQSSVETTSRGTESEEYSFSIVQQDLDKLSAQGVHTTKTAAGHRWKHEIIMIGGKWWSHAPDEPWMIMQGPGLRDRFVTSKFFFDGFVDCSQAIHRVWFLGDEDGPR